MPTFQIASDLHLEFHRDGGKSFLKDLRERCPEADGIIVAGDLATTIKTLRVKGQLQQVALLESALTQLCALWSKVIYVEGNHELYGTSLIDLMDLRAKLVQRLPNLTWLNTDWVEIEGQRIVGTTLWFPQNRQTDMYAGQLNDFDQIENFRPYAWNRAAQEFLWETLQEGDIVITHHAPSAQSSHIKFMGSPLSGFFFSNQEDLLVERKPKVWIHGHHHTNSRYILEGVEILCNPFGYAGYEENIEFNWALTVTF